jgi:NADPH:quinone reductase-like Zn-dependent oxidoreductase
MALGVEAAGVVSAVGAAVDDWAPGDEVLTHPLPWPRCRLGAAAGDGHRAVRCPGIRFVALEAGEAAFRSAVLTHPDADSLATHAFLRALARTAGQGAAHSPRAAVELAA